MNALGLSVVHGDRQARLRNAAILGGLLLWMAYTRFFWTAKALHATLPACPFLLLTGHPCPLCGGTRSFAYTWRGDLGHALALYPLGPLLFAGTLLAIPVLLFLVLSDSSLELRPAGRLRAALVVLAAVPLALSWALKLTVLPN